ncbi:MAG: S9 family peptidase, partial [Clostridia bacterium]|nr:S9 family peptidase [Clostridia bacterium]
DWATREMKPILDKDEGIGGSSVGCDAKLGGGQGFKVVGDKIYYITTNAEHGYLKGVYLNGNAFDVITADGDITAFDIFEDKIFFTGLRGNEIAELYVLENGAEKKLSHHNDELWATLSISTPEFFSFTASDGYDIHGYVMKPIGYEEGKKYPAILHIHGGPKTAFGSVFHNEMQVWANAGYFVCFCNPRGSDGRGNDFADIFGKYGSVDYDNLMEFADKCLEKYPDIDKDNFGVGGGSYGGFMTNWIIGHTDRFKAAVTQRSISNWTTFEFTSDIGAHFTKDQHKTSTEEDAEKLWSFSPLKYLNNAKTPTLVIHSKEDYRCWLVEGVATFQALKLHGCEAKMVLFNGDNHELSRSGQPRNRIKRMEEILAWYDSHLKA